MPPFILLDEDNLVVCSQKHSIWIYDLNDSGQEPFSLPSQNCDGKKVDLEASGVTLAATFSPSGSYFAICNDYKQLILYRTNRGPGKSWEVVSIRDTPKKAMKVMFLEDDSHVLVADKSGDLWSFPCLTPEAEGKIILGHLSMLMDFALMRKNTLIATGDRDEKIRVTRYPNTYNIESFCLDHTSFVTSVLEVDEMLLTSSGDQKICCWNPLTGQLMESVAFSDHQPKVSFVDQMVYIPGKHKIYASFSGLPKMARLTTEQKNQISLECIEDLPAPVLSMCHRGNTLIALLDKKDSPLMIICTSEERYSNLKQSLDHINSDLSNKWESFKDAFQSMTEFYVNLTKMNMENVDEQMERKGKRPPSHLVNKAEPEAKKSAQVTG